ncbi:MAG TPA: hypothetical protein VGG75_13725 [Trebonia sp.]
MRLHTKLDGQQVRTALQQAKEAGHVTPDVTFTGWSEHRSNSHARAFEVQLGTYERDSLPAGHTDQRGHKMLIRKYKNSGQWGAGAEYTATWREYGWFMAEVFTADPDAKFGPYDGRCDFNEKTKNEFCKEDA